MSLHHPIVAAFPFPVLMAEIAAAHPFEWGQALLVYGPLGLWVAWFVVRDKLEREERKQDRLDQERRHAENIAAQRAIENAFRTNTNSIIVAMAAVTQVDSAFQDLLERIKEDNGK